MSEYFDAAIKAVESEVSDLWTPQGLGRLLNNCKNAMQDFSVALMDIECLKQDWVLHGLAGIGIESREVLNRIAADPTGWALDARPEIQEGAEWYGQMNKLLGGKNLSEIMLYHQIRDHIQAAQVAKGISGIDEEQHFTLFGKTLTVPSHDWQLEILPSDLPIIRHAGNQVFDFLVDSMSNHMDQYEFQEIDEEEYIHPSCFTELLSLKPRIVDCTVRSECHDWEPCRDGWRSVRCDRDPSHDPDEIDITIGLDDLITGSGDATSYRHVRFRHKDKSRFPWLDKAV